MKAQTPATTARQDIRALIAKKRSGTLTDDEKKAFRRARSLRGHVRNWRKTGKEAFELQMSNSVVTVQAQIQEGRELLNWFEGCIPTVAEYTGITGKTEIADDETVTRGNATYKTTELYQNLVRGFRHFIKIWRSRIADYENEIALYEADPVDDIVAACESLGLTQVHEDSNDGCLWFENAEGQLYYLSLLTRALFSSVSILDTAKVLTGNPIRDNWEDYYEIDLSLTAIGIGCIEMPPYAQTARDYFGIYNSLRPWIAKSVEAGNTPPAHVDAWLLSE